MISQHPFLDGLYGTLFQGAVSIYGRSASNAALFISGNYP
jgi:hypothetical protein